MHWLKDLVCSIKWKSVLTICSWQMCSQSPDVFAMRTARPSRAYTTLNKSYQKYIIIYINNFISILVYYIIYINILALRTARASRAYTTLKILAHDWKQTCELMCTLICSLSLIDNLKWVNVLLDYLSEILQDKNVSHIGVLVCCSDVNLDIFGFRTEPVSRLNSRMQIYLPVSYSSTSLRQVLKHVVLFLYLYLYLCFYFHFIHRI